MAASLYESLLGSFNSGLDINHIDDKTQTIISVMENIQRILNSRAGAVKHLPDYGMPDMAQIYQSLPSSAFILMQAMQKTILKYEPRIEKISISLEPTDNDIVLNFVLICYLKEAGLVKYGTHFLPEGRALLKYTKNKKKLI